MKYIFSLFIVFISVLQINAQCYPDRHNTTWFDGWESCEMSDNPNSSRGLSHWILYDLGHIYKLEDVHLWNVNDPENLQDGIKTVVFDYSQDGNDWVEFGEQTFEMATGKSIYEGDEAFSFDGIKARYLLMTVLETWGGDCAGFGEIRIGVAPITATELVNFDMDCDEVNGNTELSWSLTNESETVNFDVEKSFDGKNWRVVNSTGYISVKSGQNEYKYTDNSDGDAYYRIKVTEQSGNYSYTDAHFCSKTDIKTSIYPNPFNEHFTVEILAQNDDPIVYELTDIYGREIKRGIINSSSLINTLNFNDLGLEPGNYFFTVRQGSKTGHLKLIKMNSGN